MSGCYPDPGHLPVHPADEPEIHADEEDGECDDAECWCHPELYDEEYPRADTA